MKCTPAIRIPFYVIILHTIQLHGAFSQEIFSIRAKFESSDTFKETIIFYQENLGYTAGFYRGKVYNMDDESINGHPFLFTEEWIKGDLLADNRVYFNIDMRLDIYSDILVLLLQDSAGNNISVESSEGLIHGFRLYDRYFIRLSPEEADAVQLAPGFYEQAYCEKSSVLIKYRKEIHEELRYARYMFKEYSPVQDYYIIKNASSYPIKNKRSVLRTLIDKKNAVKRFIKSNRINLSTGMADDLIKIVSFYDSLGT